MVNHGVRERLEEREGSLSPFAAKSRLSRGRLKPEEPCPLRTAFQRDRDRILHSLAFRRLKYKTQVFIAPLGDHFVTRLTHTLEVAQIARTISRALNLNEDLTEAIALGHDLGHSPFGHIGEDVLNHLSPFGFQHNEQSLRVVDFLEKGGQGLNLTYEVREGILHHSKSRAEILGEGWGKVQTLEGQVCKIADIIAYINHDLADAIRAGILQEENLPPFISALGHTSSERINTMVQDVVNYSWAATGEGKTGEETAIGMSPSLLQTANQLRDFLFERVYNVTASQEDARKARLTVEFLYNYYIKHRDKLPAGYYREEEPPEQGVVDYIAGMTDLFALRLAREYQERLSTLEL